MWLYQGQPLDENIIENYWGFVYIITNELNGRKYIGKKQFRFKKSRPPLKGRKKRRISWVESDWKDYYGSNDELQQDVEKYGKKHFRREILYLCKTAAECSYLEAREQFLRDVLLRDDYYNDWVMVRVRKTKMLFENMKDKTLFTKCSKCGKIYDTKGLEYVNVKVDLCEECIKEVEDPKVLLKG